MPERPPKKWWKRCIKKVFKSGGATEPEMVCGNIWYHEKTPEERDQISKEEKRRKIRKILRGR